MRLTERISRLLELRTKAQTKFESNVGHPTRRLDAKIELKAIDQQLAAARAAQTPRSEPTVSPPGPRPSPDAAAISEYATRRGVAALAGALIRSGLALEQAKGEIDKAVDTDIDRRLALAGRIGYERDALPEVAKAALKFQTEKKSAQAFAEFMINDLAAKASPEIRAEINADAADRTALAASWDRAFEKASSMAAPKSGAAGGTEP